MYILQIHLRIMEQALPLCLPRCKMYHNLFEENWGDAAYGLLLKEISDSHIEGNKFIKTPAEFYGRRQPIMITHNLFKNNGWGYESAGKLHGQYHY